MYFQGYHFLCLLCTVVKHYFKTKYEVQRHLQDQHSGIGHQCTGCGLLFNRKNLKHKCREEHPDFVFVNRQSGAQGEVARETLMNFIKKEQDSHWMYVSAEDEPESPIPTGPRSMVVKLNDPMVQPNPRKEKKGRKVPSPVPLDNYEDDIQLEEPPRKVQKMSIQSLLEDLECSPCTSEDTPAKTKDKETMHEKESRNGKVTEKTKETKKLKEHVLKEKGNLTEKENEKDEQEKGSDKKKDDRKEKETSKGKRSENDKETENVTEDVRKVKRNDKKKDSGKEKETEKGKQNEKETENVPKDKRSDKKRDSGKEKETEKGKQNENKNENVPKDKGNDKKKESEKEKETEKGKGKEKENETDKENEKNDREKGSDKKKDDRKEKGHEKGKGKRSENDKETVKANKSVNEKKTDKERTVKANKSVNEKTTDKEGKNENDKEQIDKEKKMDKKETMKENVEENEVNKENETEIEGKKSNDSDGEPITIDNETSTEKDSDGNETETKTKHVISIKEYESRRKNIQTINSDNISVEEPFPLDNIMVEMVKTYSMPTCLTPIRETTPEPQSPPPPSPITDDEETLRAVASISVVENETFVYCSNGTDMADDNVLSELGEEIIADEIIEAVVTESVKNNVEKEIVRKEEKKQRRAEKRKRKAEKAVEKNLERESTDAEVRKKIKRDEMLAYLKASQDNRVLLNIGGTRFETSESTLKQDPESLFFLLFSKDTPNRDNYFIDRDPAHFRLILNYLRCGCSLPSESVLPRELRYLLEVKSECEFYNLQGLKDIVETRLRRFSEPGFPN